MVSTTVSNVFHKAVTIVILSIITQDIYCLPSLPSFPSLPSLPSLPSSNIPVEIKVASKCGFRHEIDFWTIKVTVVYKGSSPFLVKTGNTEICKNRTRVECLQPSSPDEYGDTCYCVKTCKINCTDETAYTFKLVILRRARVEERGGKLIMYYGSLQTDLERTIPHAIYKAVQATYCVDEYVPISPLKPVQNVTVDSRIKVGVLFCVANLLDGSRLSINGNSSSPRKGCLFQVMHPPDAPVVLAYAETIGCRRNGTFYLNINVRARITTTAVHSAESEPSMTLGAIFFFILLTISAGSALFVWCVYLQKNYDIFKQAT